MFGEIHVMRVPRCRHQYSKAEDAQGEEEEKVHERRNTHIYKCICIQNGMCFSSLTIHHSDIRSTTKTLAAPHSWVVRARVRARALSKPIEEKAIETETTKRANRQNSVLAENELNTYFSSITIASRTTK